MKKNMQDKALKTFWRTDGMDKIADLGEMKKAIVVAFYTPKHTIENHYAISPRSYFPFNDSQLNRKFDDYYECCMFAESIIIDWVQSLLIFEKKEVKSLDGGSDNLSVTGLLQ